MTSRPTPADVLRGIAATPETDSPDRPSVVATILDADGSTPLEAGAKAWIHAGGLQAGTVGGGAAEAETLRLAVETLREGRSRVLEVAFQGAGGTDPRPVCGGSLRILIHVLDPGDRAAYRAAGRALEQRQSGILVTRLPPARDHAGPSPQSRWIPASQFDQSPDLDPESLRRWLQREALVCESDLILEPVVPPPALLIVGAGHVGQALAAQAHLVGFDVTVLDDRAEFLDPAHFPPGIHQRCGAIPEEVARFPCFPDTSIVLVTRGHQADSEALAQCIQRPFAYLGMIGSRRKVRLTREHFLASGLATPQEFDRVHTPIGLPIGAVTAPEIAASIVGQLIAVRRLGQAPRLPSQ